MTVSDIERTPEIFPASAAPGRRLEEIWKTEPGLAGWFSTVDHKEIGKRYIVTALIFLVLGGIEALVMRVQLARPNQQLLTPEQYNQLFSTHGMTMIFLYALPILSGFSNYLWPLILGLSLSGAVQAFVSRDQLQRALGSGFLSEWIAHRNTPSGGLDCAARHDARNSYGHFACLPVLSSPTVSGKHAGQPVGTGSAQIRPSIRRGRVEREGYHVAASERR